MDDLPPRSDAPRPRATETDEAPAASLYTRRTGAKALFYDGSNVLLIEERRADGSTFWTLPGGGVKPQESLQDGLRRELREELRCVAHVSDDVGRCRYRHVTRPSVVTHYTIFSGTLVTSPDPNPDEGILNHEWVDPDNLPVKVLHPFGQIVQDYEDCDIQTTHSRISESFD